MTDQPLLVSIREAAAILGLGRDSTYALAHQGRLPCVRVGRRLLVPRSSLARFVEQEAARSNGETVK
jgi:excisionase family DNA binding protein